MLTSHLQNRCRPAAVLHRSRSARSGSSLGHCHQQVSLRSLRAHCIGTTGSYACAHHLVAVVDEYISGGADPTVSSDKVVKLDLKELAGGREGRRTKLVQFTCNKCETRSSRLVNPIAWDKGAVFVQCEGCEVWHMLRAAKHIVEEVRYDSAGTDNTTTDDSDGTPQ